MSTTTIPACQQFLADFFRRNPNLAQAHFNKSEPEYADLHQRASVPGNWHFVEEDPFGQVEDAEAQITSYDYYTADQRFDDYIGYCEFAGSIPVEQIRRIRYFELETGDLFIDVAFLVLELYNGELRLGGDYDWGY